jgi:hypothetical protein
MTLRKVTSTCCVLLQSVFAPQVTLAQCENKTGFAKKACEVETGRGSAGPEILTGLKADPLSTNYSDTIHPDTLPATLNPGTFRPLKQLERTDDGAFLLKAGIFEAYVESYSLDTDERHQARVAGFYPAPIKGRRANVIADALKQVELHPEVAQNDIQNLMWAIVAGTELEKMPAPVQKTAARILPQKTLALLKGATAARAIENRVLSIVNRRLAKNPAIQQEASDASDKAKQIDRDYGISDTAVEVKAATAPPVFGGTDDVVVRGTWAQMPGGFYVRYLPEGYSKLRLQVIVPDAAIAQMVPGKPLSFDPTQYIAVFAGAPAQRLGITLRPAK